jgi:Uma2 family endonuclease
MSLMLKEKKKLPKKTRLGKATRNWASPAVSRLHRFTVAQYHHMIQAGVFEDNDHVQLLEGCIVYTMTHNPPHDTAMDLSQSAISPLLPANWRVRVQSAITTRDSEPEPDVAVVKGPARRYKTSHPRPRDIGMLVEVADSSLQQDRTIQARIYARARIPIYWIINLVEAKVEVYTKPSGRKQPHYGERRDYGLSDSVPLIIAGKHLGFIPVRDLIP